VARRVTYHAAPAEVLLAAGASFDAVLSLEVIEHVNDPEGFVRCLAGLTRPGGAVVVSTLNRTARSYAMAIIAAERLLSWVPPGTHDFGKFVTPEELGVLAARAGLDMRELAGMNYTLPMPRPLSGLIGGGGRGGSAATGGTWRLSEDTTVNFISYFSKPPGTTPK
jgi:ubiquinone biosynthesis O-methyltransferase